MVSPFRRIIVTIIGVIGFTGSSYAQAAPADCGDAQKKFDAVSDFTRPYIKTSWTQIQTQFGTPGQVEEDKPSAGQTLLSYAYPGCSITFQIRDGNVYIKTYRLGAAAIAPGSLATASAQEGRANSENLRAAIASLQATANQLRQQLDQLDRAIQQLQASKSTAANVPPPSPATPLARPATPATPVLVSPVALPAPIALPSSTSAAKPLCSESGSCYGDISPATGKAKTVYVPGYYRSNGTYVRGYYRSK